MRKQKLWWNGSFMHPLSTYRSTIFGLTKPKLKKDTMKIDTFLQYFKSLAIPGYVHTVKSQEWQPH